MGRQSISAWVKPFVNCQHRLLLDTGTQLQKRRCSHRPQCLSKSQVCLTYTFSLCIAHIFCSDWNCSAYFIALASNYQFHQCDLHSFTTSFPTLIMKAMELVAWQAIRKCTALCGQLS